MIAAALLSLLSAAHLEAATAAARAFDQELALVFAIASIESEHTTNVVKEAQGGIACGPMQVRAESPEHCTRLRTDVAFGYLEGARKLRDWRRTSPRDLRAALRGYGCGYQRELVAGEWTFARPVRPADKCNSFDIRVLARAERYRREARS